MPGNSLLVEVFPVLEEEEEEDDGHHLALVNICATLIESGKMSTVGLRRQPVLVSIVVSIPACHAGDRGSIPRLGGRFFSTL